MKVFRRLEKLLRKVFGKGKEKDKGGFKYSDLVWAYGGMDGSKASEVARIRDLRVDVRDRKMYYKWVSGGCEALGASSPTEYRNTYACIFYLDKASGKWIGGKFDEVSTSREWRPLDNCADYRGWRWQPFASSGKYAFLIIGKDGKRRTNVIFS